MAKKQYALQIKPEISKQDEAKLNNQFKSIAGGFKISMSSALKVGTAIGGAGLVLAWWNHQKKSIDAVNNSFDEYLANADRLGTIANDLGANTGSFALADVGLSTFGLKQEDRDKLYAGIKSAMAEGTIVNKGGNLLGALQDIQNEYKNALKTGNTKRQEQLKGLTGLRGQKATEFLSGNLEEQITKLSSKYSRKDIEIAVNKGGALEQQQAESLANQQLEGLIQASKVANEGIIKSQEQYNEALRQATLEQYGNYDNQIKIEIAKQKTITQLWKLIDGLVNPILTKFANTNGNNAISIISSLLGAIFSEIFSSFKSAISGYIKDILNMIGIGKFLGIKQDKPRTEIEKNNKIQDYNNPVNLIRNR